MTNPSLSGRGSALARKATPPCGGRANMTRRVGPPGLADPAGTTHEMSWDDLTEVQYRHFDRYILRSDKRRYRIFNHGCHH